MTRTFEVVLRRTLQLLACVMLLSAMVLLVYAFSSAGLRPEQTVVVPDMNPVQNGQKSAALSPKIEKLAQTQLNKTIIAAKTEAAPKPPAASLGSLIRLKGIMDFGDPKNNEAIIEHIKSNQTKSYRVGESVQDVGAVIVHIDNGVTFKYDGKDVRLNVNSEESAEIPPTAGSGNDALSDRSKIKQMP